MKFKGFILAAFAALFALASCEPEQVIDSTKLELSTKALSFEAEAQSQTITLISGRTWQAQFAEGVDWVSVTPGTGSAAADPQTITITVVPNDSYERTTYITFTTGLIEETLKITQAGKIVRNYTAISDVRAQNPATSGQKTTLGENILVKGTVVSNADLDNFTSGKTCYIQDETGGLQIFFAANHSFAFGDIIEVDLSGATLENYSMSAEISGLALANATKIGAETPVAKVVSMADYMANKYEGQYVELEVPVQVNDADLSKTWVVGSAHTNINMEDENGNKFIVRSGKFSSYGKETVAQGSGKIKGIATVFNSDIQLVFAQTSDYAALTGARFERKVTPASAEGLVVAASEKTYLIKTAEGYEYVFVGADATHTIKVGDNVKVDGEASVHNNVPQIINPTATVASSGNEVTHSSASVLDAAGIDAYNAESGLFGYVKVTGLYTKSGNYHNLAFTGASRKGSLAYPASVPAEFNGKNVDVTGYFVGISGSVYFNILVTDIQLSAVQPEAPKGEACTMINKTADLTAGTYYAAGYLEASTGTGATTFTPYSYHVWTGTLATSSSGTDAVTVTCSYANGELVKSATATDNIALIELVAVEGKENTYYVKSGDKYLTSTATATNRRLSLGTTQTEWTASDYKDGGIVFAAKDLQVQWGTANAASKLLRTYKDASAESSLKYGLVFFKKAN